MLSVEFYIETSFPQKYAECLKEKDTIFTGGIGYWFKNIKITKTSLSGSFCLMDNNMSDHWAKDLVERALKNMFFPTSFVSQEEYKIIIKTVTLE